MAAAELTDEGRVEPRLVDPQARVGQQPVAVEALDVVALEGRAVPPDLERMWNAPQVSAASPSSASAARQSTSRAISAP
jgi:hypothetical protein